MLSVSATVSRRSNWGLVPGGEITGQKEDSPTLTFNTIGRHISRMVYRKGSEQQISLGACSRLNGRCVM